VVAAIAAGVYAREAARATLQQRQHATSPAFIELLPSGQVPSDVVGLAAAQEPVEVSLGQERRRPTDMSNTHDVSVAIDDGRRDALWVVQWSKLPSVDDWLALKPTVGDLRKVIVQRRGGQLGVSVPLTNVGTGVAVIENDSVRMAERDAQAPQRFAGRVNRPRVPPNGTVRLEVLLEDHASCQRDSVCLEFTFTSMYFGEPVLVELRVAKGEGGTKRWFVTEMAHRRIS
jgi:hypothetical protein